MALGEQLRLGMIDRKTGQSGELIRVPTPIAENEERIEGGYAEGLKQCGIKITRLEGVQRP